MLAKKWKVSRGNIRGSLLIMKTELHETRTIYHFDLQEMWRERVLYFSPPRL